MIIKYFFLILILIFIKFLYIDTEKKELKFIHITKTAGTTIEDIAYKHNILWGRHDKDYGWWHRTNTLYSIFFYKKLEYMRSFDFFLICRNPYDRILSEFHCKWGGVGKDINSYDRIKMNKFIQESINNRNNLKIYNKFNHYTEQYKYIPPKILKIKTHILYFENLTEDFNNLMNKYNLPLKLNMKLNTSKKNFSINDFSDETIKLINQVYDKDFKIFGYKKFVKF